ncbi:unnamed protein product [Rotaria socialis]|uniref:Peptidylamidoglycolate lyase n=1 Tax=Rotaria socialis TaxID=392032 RepID=A0A817UU01_9BILA|nr:unnamed protein product [Rotaria socialis]CAF4097495.1 unnamed protein product [Rotaria socialis]
MDRSPFILILSLVVNIPANAKWTQNGVTIAGGHGQWNANNQLNWPYDLFVDDDQTAVIADYGNHRIMQWKKGDTTNGQVVVGGKGTGNGLHQLNFPTDVLLDKETDSLLIFDWGNRRVLRWPRRSGTTQGEILIDKIACWGLAMNEQRYLYVSDIQKHEVRRYQFEGIVVAGGQHAGYALTQLYHPEGIFVDTLGTVYVADSWNHRVMRWTQGDKKQGTVIAGGNGQGEGANQFHYPVGFSFDRQGNLYVADLYNHRVQRFSIE